MSTAVATKRVCACGCGVPLSRYNRDDYTYSCRNTMIERGEIREDDSRLVTPQDPYTREELLAFVRKRGEELGRTPHSGDFSGMKPNHAVLRNHFGSIEACLVAAGFPPLPPGRKRRNTVSPRRAIVLDALKSGPMTYQEINTLVGDGQTRRQTEDMLRRMKIDGLIATEKITYRGKDSSRRMARLPRDGGR